MTGPAVGINAPQRWTLKLEINTNAKIAKGLQTTERTDGQTDRHIILPLRGFEPVACRRMRCGKLWAALL